VTWDHIIDHFLYCCLCLWLFKCFCSCQAKV